TILSVALENTWCPDLQEAIEKLPMEDDDRQLLCDQLNFFNQDLLLSVLKRGSPALRAYHEEHPEYLSVIYSVSLDQPKVFELINQQYLNNPAARQYESGVSEGMTQVLPYVKLLLTAL
ncbi:unnamed protein product, partial [Symbiodinium microadriaticum]